jgi:hypothetical protein
VKKYGREDREGGDEKGRETLPLFICGPRRQKWLSEKRRAYGDSTQVSE